MLAQFKAEPRPGRQLATGAAKHFPAGIQLPLGGATLTLAQVEAQLQGYASLRGDVDTARAALQATRAARGTKGSKVKQAIHGEVTGVVVTPVTVSQPVPAAGGASTAPSATAAPVTRS